MVAEANVDWTVLWERDWIKPEGRGKRACRTPPRLWLYRYACITWNAAGEGRARGRTVACSVDDEGREELGKRGREEQCEARTML